MRVDSYRDLCGDLRCFNKSVKGLNSKITVCTHAPFTIPSKSVSMNSYRKIIEDNKLIKWQVH